MTSLSLQMNPREPKDMPMIMMVLTAQAFRAYQGLLVTTATTIKTDIFLSTAKKHSSTTQYACPTNSVIAGIISYHDNHKKDPRFAFRCCNAFDHQHRYCRYLNSFDGYLSWHYLAGVSSYHDNH
ncbi:hypothetical protein AALO_G00054600 [Alosa alosa]|uniref:Uncharacterized protein n=1 Tax=Alosa alosa TaxID=278164 RepID=A0AAV6H8I1_9TELE|nr:hypothetical protein AALO_G00054600 [Alosa alosa]